MLYVIPLTLATALGIAVSREHGYLLGIACGILGGVVCAAVTAIPLTIWHRRSKG